MLAFILYFSRVMEYQVYDYMKNTLELYNTQISQGFNDTLLYLMENCSQNADITSIHTSQTASETALYTIRIKNMLAFSSQSFSYIGGRFIYSPTRDLFIPCANNTPRTYSASNETCQNLLKQLMQEHTDQDTLDQLELQKWFILSNDEDHFLVRILKIRNTYAGAWASLEQISSNFDYFKKLNATVHYVSPEGEIVGSSAFDTREILPQNALEQPILYRQGLSKKYITVAYPLDYCDYYIMAFIPYSSIFQYLLPPYTMVAFVLVWLIILILSLIRIITRYFDMPNLLLQPVIASLRNGQFDTKVENTMQVQEIQQITDTFNEMISEIHNLRIHVYEEQIAKRELELQHLKTQIAPHFLINCLNTIFVLAQDKDNLELTNTIIQTLSDHLRYTLATRNTVSLSEEMHYVKNYIHLTQLRFPDSLDYTLAIEPAIQNAQVFPLLLLMLTENSVKTGVIMGESFLIHISGYLYERNSEERVHLVHIDSGRGFTEESLELYNHITDHPDIRQNGYSIGLYNTARRLSLMLGSTASIRFSNEPGMGARIDLDFPYVIYQTEEEK